MGRFSGKVVIVTGSSNGIGRATAIHFARDGAKVTITGRDAKALETTKSECIKAGAKEEDLLEILGDITAEDVQNKLIDETVKKFSKLDILINNHGGGFKERDHAGNLILELFDNVIDVNCKSTLAMCLKALRYLQATKGCIVNISSIASTLTVPNPYYAMAKAALDHITRNLAMEHAKDGIRINAVNPGIIKTEFMKKLGYTDESIDKFLTKITAEAIPVGRYGVPDDIAEMITFLADEKTAGFITGQTIIVDGGTTLSHIGFSREFLAAFAKH